MEYKRLSELAVTWSSFKFQWKVNGAGVPGEETTRKASRELVKRDQAKNIKEFKTQLTKRTEEIMAGKPAPPM